LQASRTRSPPMTGWPCNSVAARGNAVRFFGESESRDAWKSSGVPSLGFAALAALLAVGLATSAHAQGKVDSLPLGNAGEIRAQLTARNFTTLSSETSARIDRIASRVGQHFKKGDPLIVFDCATQRAQVARARAVLTQAEKTAAINQRL